MKGSILSNCERNFILKAAAELKRLDGRKLESFRSLKVVFGKDWGLCHVSLGETKVLTQVTCEIQEPKATKPNEGLFFINVELSPMASPHFESGRISNLSVHINRLLEKCLKDSRAVDLESLCIVAEDKVWVLKVDVNILNHDGCLVDCASISALAALAHFKRPDVTTDGVEIKVHNISDRDPIPITLHHYPVCVSFALLNNSENIFSDPTALEEKVSDASLTFGINAYKEICCLHLGGTGLISPKLILNCSIRAASRAKEIVQEINRAIEKDAEARQMKQSIGFVHSFEWDRITAISNGELKIQLSSFVNNVEIQEIVENSLEAEETENYEVKDLGDNCAELLMKASKSKNSVVEESNPEKKRNNEDATYSSILSAVPTYGEGGQSTWGTNFKMPGESSIPSNPDSNSENMITQNQTKQIESINLEEESEEEEEEVIIINMLEPSASHSSTKSNKSSLTENKKNIDGLSIVQTNEQYHITSEGQKKKKKKRRNKQK